tara:strand:+ start:61 stop:447 length:387 start_codon:yes stop_codon:yes gene_type:complete
MHHSDYMEDFNNAMGKPSSFGYSGFKPAKGSLLNTSVLDKRLQEIKGTGIVPDVYEKEPVLMEDANKKYRATLIGGRIGSSLGFIVALGYAFKVKSGFWKGWGYTILGSMALGGLGAGVGFAIDSSKK